LSRTKTFDEDTALEAAMLLFWEKGYSETSIIDLEKGMNLKRTSIYNAFGNKRNLFQLTLERYLNVILKRFILAVEQGDTARQSINNILNEVIYLHFNPVHPGGCLVVLSVLENNQHDTKTNLMLDGAIRLLQKSILVRLKQAEKDNEFSRSIKLKEVANQVVAMITGMLVMAKAGFSEDELQKLIDSTVRTIFE